MLLDGVSGQISLGFYAIMGPSGSGKTTLLNSLACRLDKGTKMTGEVRLNGKKYTLHDLKMNAGYGAARVASVACRRVPRAHASLLLRSHARRSAERQPDGA